jgi:hypothetical protein
MSYWRAEDSLNWEDEVLTELARKNKTTKSDMLERLERRTYPVWIKVFAVVTLGLVVYGSFGAEKYFLGSAYLLKYRKASGFANKIMYLEKALDAIPCSKTLIMEEIRLLRYMSRREDVNYLAGRLMLTRREWSDFNDRLFRGADPVLATPTLDEMVLANWMMDNMMKKQGRAGS